MAELPSGDAIACAESVQGYGRMRDGARRAAENAQAAHEDRV